MDAKLTRDEMIEANLPLAKKIAGDYWVRCRIDLHYDDFLAWATIGLIHAVDHYIPSPNNNFGTYAFRCIQGQVIRGIDTFRGIKVGNNGTRKRSLEFHRKFRQFGELTVAKFTDRGHERIEVIDELNRVLSILTTREQDCLRMLYIEGVSYLETGKRLGVSRQRVFQIRDRELHTVCRYAKKRLAGSSSDSFDRP